jgi:hypothetical protein
MVNQSLKDRFGSGPEVTRQLQQNMQLAQGWLTELKNRLSSLSSGSADDGGSTDIPSFKPSNQRTKTFLQRLEYGCNLQSQKTRYIFLLQQTSESAWITSWMTSAR